MQGRLLLDVFEANVSLALDASGPDGAGIEPGLVHGSTDEFGYNIAEHPVHVNDLHATILHCLGIDHERLTYPFGGRDFRLTDVAGHVVREVLA